MKNISYSFLLILLIAILDSCSKDIGNYDYQEINQVTFTDFKSETGYQASYGDVLSISPALAMTMDQSQNEQNYSYEWSLRLGGTSSSPLRDSIISVARNLQVKILLNPGAYSLQYRVTDKGTGVQFQKRAALTVTTDVYEGYMVLTDVDGQSRLDMLSYKTAGTAFVQYTDVLKKMGSGLPQQGRPYQVLCQAYSRANVNPQNYGIFQLTASGATRLSQESLSWVPAYGIANIMLGNVPKDFAPQRLTGAYNNTSANPVFCMYANDNMYTYSTISGWAFKYDAPINVYSPGGTPFRISPYVATDGISAVMYNLDKKNFVTMASYSVLNVTDVATALSYPSGLDLLYMDCNYYPEAGQVKTTYAILKNPTTSKVYMLRFILGLKQDYYEEIIGAEIAGASNYAFSPDLGYMFYSVGAKVYEYDLALKKSKLMLDKGTSEISLLSFPHFYDRFGKANYLEWSKWLNVGYYDPAGTQGGNGTLEQYSVPVVNGQIVLTNKWTGFGKVVSVAYRGR